MLTERGSEAVNNYKTYSSEKSIVLARVITLCVEVGVVVNQNA